MAFPHLIMLSYQKNTTFYAGDISSSLSHSGERELKRGAANSFSPLAPAARARTVGFMTGIYGIGQIIGPTLAGYSSAHTGSYHTAVFISAAAVTTAGVLLIPDAFGRSRRGYYHHLWACNFSLFRVNIIYLSNVPPSPFPTDCQFDALFTQQAQSFTRSPP